MRFIASLKICVLNVFILCLCFVLNLLNFLRTQFISASIFQISKLSIFMKNKAYDETDEQTIKKVDDAKLFWCFFISSFAYWQTIKCCWDSNAFFCRAFSLFLNALVLRRLRIYFEKASSSNIFHENLQILTFSEVFSSRTHSNVNIVLKTWSIKEKSNLLLQQKWANSKKFLKQWQRDFFVENLKN